MFSLITYAQSLRAQCGLDFPISDKVKHCLIMIIIYAKFEMQQRFPNLPARHEHVFTIPYAQCDLYLSAG